MRFGDRFMTAGHGAIPPRPDSSFVGFGIGHLNDGRMLAVLAERQVILGFAGARRAIAVGVASRRIVREAVKRIERAIVLFAPGLGRRPHFVGRRGPRRLRRSQDRGRYERSGQ